MEARDMFEAVLRRLDQKSQEIGAFIETERRLERQLESLEPELKATTEKLGEWIDYSRKLRALLMDVNANANRRKKVMFLPAEPGPVETEIPF